MSAIATLIPNEQKQIEVENLILELLKELKKPVEINTIADLVFSKDFFAEYEFRSALSHLLASHKVILDSDRKIKFA